MFAKGVPANVIKGLEIGYPIQQAIMDHSPYTSLTYTESFAVEIKGHLMQDMNESYHVEPCDSIWDILKNNGLW